MALAPYTSGIVSAIVEEVTAQTAGDLGALVSDATTQANRAAISVPWFLRADLIAAPSAANGARATVTADTGTHVAVSGEVALGGAAATVGALIPNNGRYTYTAGAWLRTGDGIDQLASAQADRAQGIADTVEADVAAVLNGIVIRAGGALVNGVQPLAVVGATDAAGLFRVAWSIMPDMSIVSTSFANLITMTLAGLQVQSANVAGYKLAFTQLDASGRHRLVFGVTDTGQIYPGGAGSSESQQTYTAESFTAGIGTNERLHYIDGAQAGTTALIRIVLGQSNANGQNTDAADALLGGTALHSGKALMLQGTGGPRAQFVTGTTLVDLVEAQVTEGGATQKDTPVSGWVNHLIRDINAKFGFKPTVVGMVSAQGGQPYLGLKRGSTAYNNLLTRLKLIVAALRARGFTSFQTSVAWVGSETDTTDTTLMTPSRMAYQLQQFSRQLNGDIKAITGEVEDVVLFTVQPGNVRTGFDRWAGNFVREGFRVANRRDNIVLVGGAYQTSMSDGIHRSNIGKLITGQNIAMADLAENFGGGWRLGLQNHSQASGWLSSTQCFVDLDFMGTAPVIDTSEAMVKIASGANNGALPNNGFYFEDDSGAPPAISSVAISGSRVVVTLASAPTGPRKRLGYAIARTGTGSFATWDGGTYGARGCLRDNAASTNLYDSSTQYAWFPAFIVQL